MDRAVCRPRWACRQRSPGFALAQKACASCSAAACLTRPHFGPFVPEGKNDTVVNFAAKSKQNQCLKAASPYTKDLGCFVLPNFKLRNADNHSSEASEKILSPFFERIRHCLYRQPQMDPNFTTWRLVTSPAACCEAAIKSGAVQLAKLSGAGELALAGRQWLIVTPYRSMPAGFL